jgi:hypothetical protein
VFHGCLNFRRRIYSRPEKYFQSGSHALERIDYQATKPPSRTWLLGFLVVQNPACLKDRLGDVDINTVARRRGMTMRPDTSKITAIASSAMPTPLVKKWRQSKLHSQEKQNVFQPLPAVAAKLHSRRDKPGFEIWAARQRGPTRKFFRGVRVVRGLAWRAGG